MGSMNQRTMRRLGGILVTAAAVFAGYSAVRAEQSAAAEGKEQPYVVEYYYKAKWGHAEEFLVLFKKNHYPVLKKEMELGRMLKVSMTAPRLHATRTRGAGHLGCAGGVRPGRG